jgi:hypothetical protein
MNKNIIVVANVQSCIAVSSNTDRKDNISYLRSTQTLTKCNSKNEMLNIHNDSPAIKPLSLNANFHDGNEHVFGLTKFG